MNWEFVEFPVIANPNSRSLRASAHTGVAISRIEAPFLDNIQVDSEKQHKKNGLYDDGLSEIRWRFPHQCEHWFGMTALFEVRTYRFKIQFVYVPSFAILRYEKYIALYVIYT